ncbi:mucin-5AC-like isoform X2 [Pomacea canaliculata]|nr:mucin-5AC-like isoform X2 [Pomacea canaliculata]XP_025099479.1 mucin-5AC-like isoform X2 [Pomacea canaliculata]XP_025099480.1 mucin-5AC-like isoform X2 [Pomacea canaliculata]
MADAVTREASKKGAVLAATTQTVSGVSTQQKKGSTTAKLQLLSSGGLRLITPGGTALGQANTGEPAKGQQRFFTRQTTDGQWQLLMSYDSDPGRVFLLQAPTSQPMRASESKAVSKATKTDSSSSKMPMKVFLVNPKDNRQISPVASSGRSLLGGQEKTDSRAAKVPGKAISLLPSSLHLSKVETTRVKAASTAGRAEAGSAGNAPISNTKGSYLVSMPTITASTQRTPRRWPTARSPRLVQLEKPITSRRANRVVKPPAAAALLSGALKKCKKFPKIKNEPVIKKERVFDRDPAGYDSDSADDLPVTFPFKIDSVFSLSSPDPAAATLNEENEAQDAEVKMEVNDEPVSEQFCQEELSQEELLDMCGSSFVVLERLSKQNINEKAQPGLRSRCSDYCRKRTLKYLCMLNLIKCRPSKMKRDERDACGGQSEEGTSDEGSSGERIMHGEGGAGYGGLAANNASQNASSDFSSKRPVADIKSVVAGAVRPTVSTHVGVISDVTHAPTDRQRPSFKSKNTTVTLMNSSDDASDKMGMVQDDVSGVKKSEGVKRASAPAKTPTTLSSRSRQAASAAVKNLANLVRKGSVAMSEHEKKLVILARKEPKTSSPMMGHSSPSATAPSVTCVQLLSAPGMGPTAKTVVPPVTSASSGTAPSVPPTSCVLTFIITTSASTVAASRPSLVTSSSTSKPTGLQTLMIPGSFQTVPSAAATVRQPNEISKSVPLLQTPTSLVSFLQGSKIGKTSPAILSATPQPTVVMTAVAPPASGLQMPPMTTNAIVPTSKTSTAGVTSMSSALTTATCSVTSLSSPSLSVGLKPIAPKAQSTLQTSSAAILMSVAVDDSLSQTLHAAPSRTTQGLVPDSSATSTAIPTILAFSKPILTSVPQLPSAGELSDLKTIPSLSPSVTSANVSSIEPFPSSSAKCPPLRTFVTPTVTPGSKGPLVTIPSNSFKSAKSKIKIVFPVNSSAMSVVTGTSLLKAIPSSAPSAPSLSHPAVSSNVVGRLNAGEVPSGPIPSLNTEPVVSGASMHPESNSSGSKVKVVTVVFPKAARASAGSQTGPSQLLNANLPAGLRLVKCGKPENGDQPRPKYSLFSSGSKMASACKTEVRSAGEGKGKAKVAHEAVMVKPSSTTTCTASGENVESAVKRRSTEDKGDAERRAKRARLEKRYPLPPGVVIKCEPVTSGYPGDDAPNAASMEVPPPYMADDVRPPQTSGQGATRGEETRFEPPGGNEVEAQLPELETGDEAVARDESETDDFLFGEPPVLTPVSPLEPGSSPDTASLVTELSAALHQKPASRLRVRIVSATGKDVAADTPPLSSSSSSSSSSSLLLPSGSAAPSSSSFPPYIPKTTSSVPSSSAGDRIRQLREQLRKQQDELDEIRKQRALQKPFCLEGDS